MTLIVFVFGLMLGFAFGFKFLSVVSWIKPKITGDSKKKSISKNKEQTEVEAKSGWLSTFYGFENPENLPHQIIKTEFVALKWTSTGEPYKKGELFPSWTCKCGADKIAKWGLTLQENIDLAKRDAEAHVKNQNADHLLRMSMRKDQNLAW